MPSTGWSGTRRRWERMRWSVCSTTRRRSAARSRRSWPTAQRRWWSRSRAESMLRKAILAYGVLAVIGAIALALAGIVAALVFYLFVNGAIVLAAVLFDRGRHRPASTPGGPFHDTGERCVEPPTGELSKRRAHRQA